jgi:UDP-N-acetylglucosamine 2-epimerase (non-hydrolysing)
VASKLGIKVAHVEAGLRSNDWSMPEEVNRVLTDRLSDLLLTPSADGDENLAHEGIDSRKIVRVGNVMIDTLLRQRELAAKSAILHKLELQSGKYAVLTLHRPSNVDDPQALKSIFIALEEISEKIPVVFPAHPRTQVRLKEFGVGVKENISVLEPMGYIDFLQLWSHSLMVLTDSGGLQEETTALGIPCLTLRENTERPVTVTEGTNQIVGCNPHKIRAAAHAILENGRNASPTPLRCPEMWDGKAAERIVDALIQRARR